MLYPKFNAFPLLCQSENHSFWIFFGMERDYWSCFDCWPYIIWHKTLRTLVITWQHLTTNSRAVSLEYIVDQWICQFIYLFDRFDRAIFSELHEIIFGFSVELEQPVVARPQKLNHRECEIGTYFAFLEFVNENKTCLKPLMRRLLER